jgi:hypothetical protein
MSVIVVRSAQQGESVREALRSVVPDHATVHLVRLPTVDSLDPLVEAVGPTRNYGVDFTTRCLPDVPSTVEFVVDRAASCVCIGISERTSTGKARIDPLTQSLLLEERLSGTLVVGNDVITLREMEYDT